jgi:mRNA-degrading endonuclease toxin of MazEF toxin-antitoxin module
MSRHSEVAGLTVKGHVYITDESTGEVLLDQDNAIHPQNMARIIARALANEENGIIHRIAFGNGGTFIDVGGNIVYRQPNDGNNGAGWEARLYRETYSEIVDDGDALLGTDPGSAGPDNIRTGGGTSGAATTADHKVISEEVGKQSNIIISMLIDENEPSSQLANQSTPSPTLEESEDTFIFDEIGLYSPGLSAVDTSAFARVDVGNVLSTDDISPALAGSTDYALRITLDGTTRDAVITTPAPGSGTGTSGAFTYGDLCDGLNGGAWISSGFDFSNSNGAFFFVTDRSGGSYSTITGQEAFGFFNVQSKLTGATSGVLIPEDTPITGNDNILYVLANSIWSNVVDAGDDSSLSGLGAGVINDAVVQSNERERLLSHIVFTPILKSSSSIIRIVYTLTVTVSPTQNSDSTVTVDS